MIASRDAQWRGGRWRPSDGLDLAGCWGLYATVGQGSIWMLAPLGHNEVVRVSMTTGKPLGVVYPGGSCSRYCSQIYDAAGAVWEPTSQQILRIDPAKMPG